MCGNGAAIPVRFAAARGSASITTAAFRIAAVTAPITATPTSDFVLRRNSYHILLYNFTTLKIFYLWKMMIKNKNRYKMESTSKERENLTGLYLLAVFLHFLHPPFF